MPVSRLIAGWAVTLAAGPLAMAAAAERYVGTVAKLETSPPAMSIELDAGGQKWVAVPPEASLLRVAPGETNLSGAAKLRFDELRAGDRVLVRAEGEPPIASQILVLSLDDLAQKQKAERADWKNRGVSGRVLAVDSQNGAITIAAAAGTESAPVVIRVATGTEQRRYRADSSRFSDARPSTILAIREGDQLQALGDRTPDGHEMTAVKIVSGTFRNFTATVAEVKAASQEMIVRPAAGGPVVTVKIAPGAILRKLSAEASAHLAGKQASSASGPRNLLDGSSLTMGDFGRGDAVVIATLNGAGADAPATSVTAVAVIAGVERLLKRSAEAQKEVLGSWNLSLDPESAAGGQR